MKHSIWLVDDMPSINIINTHILSKVEAIGEITSFDNPEDFIAQLKDENSELPDFILVDLNMPQMDGFELLEYMCGTDNFKSKIFVLTTSINPADEEKVKSFSCVCGFIMKPLTTEIIESDIIGSI